MTYEQQYSYSEPRSHNKLRRDLAFSPKMTLAANPITILDDEITLSKRLLILYSADCLYRLTEWTHTSAFVEEVNYQRFNVVIDL